MITRIRSLRSLAACAALGAVVTLPAVAIAAPAVEPTVLANVDAMLDSCASVNSGSVKGASDYVAAVAPGAKADDLKAVRTSENYKAAYETTRARITQFDPKELAKACAGMPRPH